MEALLRPETGLIIWTLLTFTLLVILLGKLAWKPLMSAIEEREDYLRSEREAAEQARIAAEKIRNDLEERLSAIKSEAQATMEAAYAEGAQVRDEIMGEAKAAARAIAEKTRTELEAEKQKLVDELRKEVGYLSVMAAERILKRQMDSSVQKEVLEDFFRELDQKTVRK
ncbi:MAG: F0F1 ATP synthase subunit B [bacterium]